MASPGRHHWPLIIGAAVSDSSLPRRDRPWCSVHPCADQAADSLDQEVDPDVYYISKGESHLDIKAWIYEFINLSIPMQKTCDYEAMDGTYCNPAARELLNGLKADEEAKENPIWKDLKGKFKDLE